MCRTIAEFDQHTEHVLVHTGQNYDYELNEVFFRDLDIRKPDYFLGSAGKNATETIANVLTSVDSVIEKEMPDAVLLYGDTNSCLAVIAAKRRKVPIFHMEAGNRCFDQRVPEEINRKIVDHLSDVNLVLTEHARRYLLDEGIRPELIFKTGSHMPEVLEHFSDSIQKSSVLESLDLSPEHFFLVSIHREENIDYSENLFELIETLNCLAHEYKLPIIVSTHPRTRKRIESLNISNWSEQVRFLPPFGFFDYVRLQKEAKCVVSDSGTITEESSLLGFPAVMIRNAHERPEGMDVGAVIMAGLTSEAVLNAIKVATSHHAEGTEFQSIRDYVGNPVSKQVLRIVLSYIPYVRRTVWKEDGHSGRNKESH
jgi:UDP-N-acetylglucosamine 2-epimerase (non-hydrolysing)